MLVKVGLTLSLLFFVSCAGDEKKAEEAVGIDTAPQAEDAGEAKPKPAGEGQADIAPDNKSEEDVQRSQPNVEAAKLAALKEEVKEQAVKDLEVKGIEDVKTKPMVVTAWKLNVRQGPGMKFGVIEQVSKGDKVDILETVGIWGRIADGKYVSVNYLTEEKI